MWLVQTSQIHTDFKELVQKMNAIITCQNNILCTLN